MDISKGPILISSDVPEVAKKSAEPSSASASERMIHTSLETDDDSEIMKETIHNASSDAPDDTEKFAAVCAEKVAHSPVATDNDCEITKETIHVAVKEIGSSVEPSSATTERMIQSPLATDDDRRVQPIQENMEDATGLLKTSILRHISKNTEAYFKSQQKDEPDLTTDEKWKIAETLLDKSVPTFLSRYAKYLLAEHLEYFTGSDDSLVQYYVEQRHIELMKSTSYSKATVRNRRLEALKRLSEKGEYFSDKEMKRRNPLLFEELVGQFLTNDQKFEFETTGDAQPTSFAAFFMDIVERGFADSKMMEEVERDVSMMNTGEPSQSSSNVVLWGEMAANSRSKQRVLNNSRPQEVTEGEKHNLLNEFRSKVFTDFLGGRDDEFDYSEVDGNCDYDDLNAMEQDQQEDYFDSESPQTVMDDDSNGGCQNGLTSDSESRSPSPEIMKSGEST